MLYCGRIVGNAKTDAVTVPKAKYDLCKLL